MSNNNKITYMAKYFCSDFCPDFLASVLPFWKINVCILVVAAIQTLPRNPASSFHFHVLFAILAPFITQWTKIDNSIRKLLRKTTQTCFAVYTLYADKGVSDLETSKDCFALFHKEVVKNSIFVFGRLLDFLSAACHLRKMGMNIFHNFFLEAQNSNPYTFLNLFKNNEHVIRNVFDSNQMQNTKFRCFDFCCCCQNLKKTKKHAGFFSLWQQQQTSKQTIWFLIFSHLLMHATKETKDIKMFILVP